MDRIYIGYISSYFGLKGEVKVISDTNIKEKVFRPGNTLYIDDKEYVISSSKLVNKIIIGFEGYDDINKINDIIKKDIYVTRESINLKEDDYLLSELLGMDVIDGESLGKVDNILLSKKSNYIKVGEMIIPLSKPYLEKVDVINKRIYIKGSKELKIWE